MKTPNSQPRTQVVGEVDTDPSKHEPWATTLLGRRAPHEASPRARAAAAEAPGRSKDESGVGRVPSEPVAGSSSDGASGVSQRPRTPVPERPSGERISGVAPQRETPIPTHSSEPLHTAFGLGPAKPPAPSAPPRSSATLGASDPGPSTTPGLGRQQDELKRTAPGLGDAGRSARSTPDAEEPSEPNQTKTWREQQGIKPRGVVTTLLGWVRPSAEPPQKAQPTPLSSEAPTARGLGTNASRRRTISETSPPTPRGVAPPANPPQGAAALAAPAVTSSPPPAAPRIPRAASPSRTLRVPAAAPPSSQVALSPIKTGHPKPTTAIPALVQTRRNHQRLWLGAAAVLGLITLAGFVPVSVSLEAPGVFRSADAPSMVTAKTEGRLTEVLVSPGQHVQPADEIARLEPTGLQLEVAHRQRSVELMKAGKDRSEALGDALDSKTLKALEGRRGVLWQGLKVRHQQLAGVRQKLARLKDLQGDPQALTTAKAEEVEALGQVLSFRAQAAGISAEIAAHTAATENARLERELVVAQAVSALQESQALATETTVVSPIAGRVEAVLARPGQVLRAGETIARIAALDAPLHVVAFLPARDVAAVRAGDSATLELSPRTSAGPAVGQATVLKVGASIASEAEVTEFLSYVPPNAPLTRVDIALSPGEASEALRGHMLAGGHAVATIATAKRSLGSLLLDRLSAAFGN